LLHLSFPTRRSSDLTLGGILHGFRHRRAHPAGGASYFSSAEHRRTRDFAHQLFHRLVSLSCPKTRASACLSDDAGSAGGDTLATDRKSTRLNSSHRT